MTKLNPFEIKKVFAFTSKKVAISKKSSAALIKPGLKITRDKLYFKNIIIFF